MTIGGSRLTVRFLFSMLLGCLCSSQLWSMNMPQTTQRPRAARYNSPYSMMNMGYSGMASNAIARIEQFRQMADVITDEKREIARREAQLAAGGLSQADANELRNEINNSQRLLESLSRCRRNMVDPKSAAYRLLVGGLAGKDAKGYIDEFNQVDNVGDAIKQGLAFRFAKGVGDVLGKRITAACEFFLGGACDFMIHKVLGLWGDFTSVLFHDSKDPFTVDILKQWQFLVKRSLEDVERLLKDGMKDTLRGYDMTKRRMDSLTTQDDKPGSSKAGDEYTNVELDSIWSHLSNTYSDVFEMIIEEIDFRKGYYDEEAMAVRHANSIKRLLMVLSQALQSSTTIADFDSKLGSTKALIPAMRKELENLFLALIEQVKPPTYSLKAKENAFDELGRKRAKPGYSYGSDNDYPNGETW